MTNNFHSNAATQTKVRQHPHKLDVQLAIINPRVLYKGTVVSTSARGAISLTVADKVGYNISAIAGLTNVTAYVHFTSNGKRIIQGSRRRVRSVNITDHIIKLDENSIVWTLDMEIWVYEAWELFPVFPYISGSAANFTFYKDRDIAYNGQNDLYKLEPIARCGGPYVGRLKNGTITFDIDGSASETIAIYAAIASYAWSCPGGVIASPSSAQTTLTITTPGLYWLHLTVTDNDYGKTHTRHCPVRVFSEDETDPPYTDFSITSDMVHDWKAGDSSMSIQVFGNASLDTLPDYSMFILWGDVTYNGVHLQSNPNNDNILFCGYAVQDSVNVQNGVSVTTFQLATITRLMNMMKMTSVSLTEVAGTPSTWYEFMAPLTVPEAVFHFWKWHSTIFDVADVYLPADTRRISACDDFSDGTLYSMIDQFTNVNGIFAHVCSDSTGRVYLYKDPNMLTPDTLPAVGATYWTILDEDRKLERDIEFIRNKSIQTASVYLAGIAYNVGLSKYKPLASAAPSTVPEIIGTDDQTNDRQILIDQNQANFLSGKLYANNTADISEYRLELCGFYPLEVVPQPWCKLIIPAAYTNRGVDINDWVLIRQVSHSFDMAGGFASTVVVLEPWRESVDGETVIIPDYEPPGSDWDSKYVPGIKLGNYDCADLNVGENGPWQFDLILNPHDTQISVVEVPSNFLTRTKNHTYQTKLLLTGYRSTYNWMSDVWEIDGTFDPSIVLMNYNTYYYGTRLTLLSHNADTGGVTYKVEVPYGVVANKLLVTVPPRLTYGAWPSDIFNFTLDVTSGVEYTLELNGRSAVITNGITGTWIENVGSGITHQNGDIYATLYNLVGGVHVAAGQMYMARGLSHYYIPSGYHAIGIRAMASDMSGPAAAGSTGSLAITLYFPVVHNYPKFVGSVLLYNICDEG